LIYSKNRIHITSDVSSTRADERKKQYE